MILLREQKKKQSIEYEKIYSNLLYSNYKGHIFKIYTELKIQRKKKKAYKPVKSGQKIKINI